MGLAVVNNGETQSLTNVKNIIGIVSGKGGVGKSTVTLNLALSLAKLGYKVGILDADIYGPSIRKMLGDEIYPNEKNGMISPAVAKGIKNISLAFFDQLLKSAVVRAPIANQIIEQFIHKTEWGELDYLLVDFPPGTGDIQLTLMQQLPFSYSICVSTPQIVSLIDVKKALEMLVRMNVEVYGIVENMSYFPVGKDQLRPFGKNHTKELAKEFGVEFLGEIPIDPTVSYCCDHAKSLFDTDAHSIRDFVSLATKAEQKVLSPKGKRNFSVEWHLNRKSFVITFSDGLSIVGKAKEVQKLCPCVRCQTISPTIDEEVFVKEIFPVGNYGLKFLFSNGCSKGIYTFSRLKKL